MPAAYGTHNLLALDTSTDRLSVAVCRQGHPQPWLLQGPGGAQSSTQLLDGIQDLMAQAALDFADLAAIGFGAGPGAFTGLRTACAVAQGLGLGAGVPLVPINTLMAVAEEARWALGAPAAWRCVALLDARMDEVYAAKTIFDSNTYRIDEGLSLISPESLVFPADWALAGNVWPVYGERIPANGTEPVAALPTATALLRLMPGLLAQGAAVDAADALPLYVRDKVAQTTAERQQAVAGAPPKATRTKAPSQAHDPSCRPCQPPPRQPSPAP